MGKKRQTLEQREQTYADYFEDTGKSPFAKRGYSKDFLRYLKNEHYQKKLKKARRL